MLDWFTPYAESRFKPQFVRDGEQADTWSGGPHPAARRADLSEPLDADIVALMAAPSRAGAIAVHQLPSPG